VFPGQGMGSRSAVSDYRIPVRFLKSRSQLSSCRVVVGGSLFSKGSRVWGSGPWNGRGLQLYGSSDSPQQPTTTAGPIGSSASVV
jgi:hypothetical protein